jgi:hypothetical protein
MKQNWSKVAKLAWRTRKKRYPPNGCHNRRRAALKAWRTRLELYGKSGVR